MTGRRAVSFGRILIEEGILSPAELRRLARRQFGLQPDKRVAVGYLAVREGRLTESGLLSLLDRHGSRLHIGELLVMRRLLRLCDLRRARAEQGRDELLGEALLRLGLIDPWALAEGLAEQTGIACIPIHHIPITPDLAQWVNGSFCTTRGIVPVACRGRCLVIALWRPQDLPATEEVAWASGLQVLPVLTTRREIEERIRILYLEPGKKTEQAA